MRMSPSSRLRRRAVSVTTHGVIVAAVAATTLLGTSVAAQGEPSRAQPVPAEAGGPITTTAAWNAWGSLQRPPGTNVETQPAVVARTSGQLDVGVLASNQVWHKWWASGSGWSPWGSLGKPPGAISAPSFASRPGGVLDVVLTADAGLWHRFFAPGSGWSPWGRVGDMPAGAATAPRAAGRASGELDVVSRTTDGKVWHKYWAPGSGWSGWGSLDGPAKPSTNDWAPAISGRRSGEIDIVVPGADGQVHHRWWSRSTGWAAWGSLGRPSSNGALNGVAITNRAGGEVDLVVGAGGDVHHRWWSRSTGWAAWGSIGSPSGGIKWAPVAAGRNGGELDVLAVGWNSGDVWHKWWG